MYAMVSLWTKGAIKTCIRQPSSNLNPGGDYRCHTGLGQWLQEGVAVVIALEVEAREMPVAGQAARRELAVADQVLAQRRELAITAARISPPAYVRNDVLVANR